MDENLMQDQLDKVIDLTRHSKKVRMSGEIRLICHHLAEAHYPPALNFFLERLDDPDSDWRQRCLELIGFHFKISPESEIVKKVRMMLMTDRDDSVRMTAAGVLGKISSLPDQALVNALISDSDWFVRRSAYLALLQLAGISYKRYLFENTQFNFKTEEPEPTLQNLKRILSEEGIEVPEETFKVVTQDD